ncbi:MAG: hypothetical protein KC776_01010 [Myxococcales bacterium]|nr:hypothetical protein [Myxococcales bacterium]MCB9582697.1 hypothetical protein [Polyangiaceae bacterium]
MSVKRVLGLLFGFVCACSSGSGSGGGGVNGSGLCKTACDKYAQAGCGTADCEQNCEQGRTQLVSAYPACTSIYDAYLSCELNQAVDCSHTNTGMCQTQMQAVQDCFACPPSTGGPQPGQTCQAADEGKEACWGCKAVVDCRYEDGLFLWRIKQDCEVDGYTCEMDTTSSGSAYCY